MIDISDLTAVQLHCPGIADFDPMPSILRISTMSQMTDVWWPP